MSRRTLAALILVAVTALPAHAAPEQADADKTAAPKGLASRIGESISHATELVMTAMGALGVPYRLGGTTAETGFDCSGFVRAMFQQAAGMILPRRAEEQAAATAKIDQKELQPGDLVFFNTLRRSYSHVGIYVGDGKFIHAPRTGAQVRVESMNVNYWQRRFNGARRVLANEEPVSTASAAPRVIDRESPAPTTVRLGGSSGKPAAVTQPASGENI
ncbi:MAG: C40 family peptidase [Ottowia sp.]|uniref:C40 family peptidase n=1 Tax=Ottowia sp. TaxID=1898956 RepID=UPI0039E622B4